MRRLDSRRRAWLAPVTLAVGLAATLGAGASARASGFDAPVIGHGQSGPSARDAAATYWNPAQLGFIHDKKEVYFGGALLYVDIRYARDRLGDYQTADSLYYTADAVHDAGAIDPARAGAAGPVKSGFPVAATGDLFFAIPVHERVTIGDREYVLGIERDDDEVEFELFRDDNADDIWSQIASGEVAEGLLIDGEVDLASVAAYLAAADAIVG